MGAPYDNFLITGTQRTGSSALAEALGTHPLIACGWEWSEHCAWRRRLRVAATGLQGDFALLGSNDRAHMESIMGPEVRWIGFRRLFGASDKWLGHPRFSVKLWWDRFERHLRWIRQRPALRIIHVRRNDPMEWLKSKYMARSTNQYVGAEGTEYPSIRVAIPLREARARVRAKQWIDARLASLAATNPYLCIEYEAMTDDLFAAAARGAGFLDCDPARLALDRTVIRKQSSGDGRQYISNYDELMDDLRCRRLVSNGNG